MGLRYQEVCCTNITSGSRKHRHGKIANVLMLDTYLTRHVSDKDTNVSSMHLEKEKKNFNSVVLF